MLEPDTAFHRRPPPLLEEAEVLEIEERGRTMLASHGYRRYEISAFARAGRRSAHNLNYWTFGDYLGIGAGAHGKVTLPEDAAVVRRARRRNPRSYMLQAGTATAASSKEIPSGPQLVLEFMMSALRLTDGVSVACYQERTGQTLAAIEKPLPQAIRCGWLLLEHDRIVPTAEGLRFLNPMLRLF